VSKRSRKFREKINTRPRTRLRATPNQYTVPVTVYISAKTAENLASEARTRGITLSQTIREILEGWESEGFWGKTQTKDLAPEVAPVKTPDV